MMVFSGWEVNLNLLLIMVSGFFLLVVVMMMVKSILYRFLFIIRFVVSMMFNCFLCLLLFLDYCV